MNEVLIDLISGLLSAQYDSAAEAIEEFRRIKPNIFIFGAGAAGKLIAQDLAEFDIPVYRFVDNDTKKAGGQLEGIPIISFRELINEKNPKKIIIGTVAYHSEVVNQCLNGGVPENEICFADFLHYADKKVTRKYLLQNTDAIAQIYAHCADKESKELFIGNLLYQFNRDRRHYQGNLTPLASQYYEPGIMKFCDHEVYFDCGAKDGDTATKFHELMHGDYKKIYAFEPDKENYSLLQENIHGLSKIEAVNAGVGESEMELAFDGSKGGHSAFHDYGKVRAKIIPLDYYFNEHPTLIKMDIEGFELSALRGAKKILQNDRPKLAICVYHKPCDLVELPKYILEQCPDYKIFFRLYRDFGHDMVCYCI